MNDGNLTASCVTEEGTATVLMGREGADLSGKVSTLET